MKTDQNHFPLPNNITTLFLYLRSTPQTLARLSSLEQAIVQGVLSCLPIGTRRQGPIGFLVSRRAGLFRLLHYSTGQKVKGVWSLWSGKRRVFAVCGCQPNGMGSQGSRRSRRVPQRRSGQCANRRKLLVALGGSINILPIASGRCYDGSCCSLEKDADRCHRLFITSTGTTPQYTLFGFLYSIYQLASA